MVFARYVMFSEVYWHHAVRAATSMFARAFFELRHRLDLNSFFQSSEPDAIVALRKAAAETRCEPLLAGIFGAKRGLYKRVAEFSLYQIPETYRLLARRPCAYLMACAESLAEQLSASVGEPVGTVEILIDAPPPHREIEFDVEIYFPKEDVYRPLHQVSPVVDALARTQFDDYVKRVRVFAPPAPRPTDRLVQRVSNLPGQRHLGDARHAVRVHGLKSNVQSRPKRGAVWILDLNGVIWQPNSPLREILKGMMDDNFGPWTLTLDSGLWTLEFVGNCNCVS